MHLKFSKYQATGNDFIMIDGRHQQIHLQVEDIAQWCHRRFGIGADGIIVLKNHPELDFEMDYYNADGSQSFCGNGSRCAQAFANQLGMIKTHSRFLAIDGIHQGKEVQEGYATHMSDVNADRIETIEEDYLIHTGSPHFIRFVDQLDDYEVVSMGRSIRNSPRFAKEGVNVNFVSIDDGHISVRTYERGVENETYSCGTGVTAAAIAFLIKTERALNEVAIHTKGGNLAVELRPKDKQSFDEIWLKGPAVRVFSAEL